MNWYKKANKDWKPFLNNLHEKKDEARKKAEQIGKELGHFLDGWGPMNSCYCRKCGAYAKINGFYETGETKTFYGAAFTNPCNVKFDNNYNFSEFKNPNPKNCVL